MDGDEFEIGEAVEDVAEPAVEEEVAVVDDDDASTELLDVGHVMAGEQDGGLAGRVVIAQEFADILLRNHVEADGGFVEEEDAGLVEQRGDELHFHAFAEGEFADHDVRACL